MALSFAKIKAKARRDVHASLSVAATYQSYSLDKVVKGIRVRWHNKMAMVGDIDNNGYANMLEGIERIIFERAELERHGIELQEGDTIIITDEGFMNAQLILKVREPIVGPFEVIWQVARGI